MNLRRALGPAPLVLLAALLLGAAALAAELLWIRGLGRALGIPAEGAAGVIGLMLLGMGLGAIHGARRAAVHERPARGAALALLLAGTWIALSPHYLAHVGRVGGSLRDALGEGIWAWMLLGLLLCAPLVLPAAYALGRAFPLLVRARVMDLDHAARRVGTLYALDTAGALLGVAGALACLALLGEAMTLRAAGGAALLAALVLLLSDRPLPHGDGPPPARAPDGHAESGRLGLPLAASGAAALMAQLAWLRMLQPLAGAHELGTALLLGPILLAIALGAALVGPLVDRLRAPARVLPWLLLAGGALTWVSLPTAGGAPLDLLARTSACGSRVGGLVLAFALTVMPASLCFGALLPAAVRVRASWTGSTAGPAGRLYGWNALGALVGSLVAGFGLLPGLGAERTLLAAGALALLVAAGLRWRIRRRRRALGLAVCLLPAAVLAWPGVLPAWLGSGPATVEVIAARHDLPVGMRLDGREDLALYARHFAGQLAARPDDSRARPVPVFEGRLGRVTLVEEPSGVVGLRRGALRESVFAPDDPRIPSRTEYALGLLPCLFAPQAERALVIGHGAGWTAEAVLAASTAHVDVAEVDPAILDAARLWRGLEALPVERLERARIVPRDGRQLLRAAAVGPASVRYDVIVSQPSHPWSRASGHLFSLEAFQRAHDALREDGVMAQWLGLDDLTPTLLRRALASFHGAFAEAWVFRFPGEIVLLGFRGRPRLQEAAWAAFFHPDDPRGDAARRAGLEHAADLFKHAALDTAALERVLGTGDVEPLRDDRPELELTLARRRLLGAAPEAAEEVLLEGFPPAMEAVLPDARTREAWLTGAVQAWLAEGGVAEAALWCRTLRFGTSPEGELARATTHLREGRARAAEGRLRAAREHRPADAALAVAWVEAATAIVTTAPAVERTALMTRVDELLETGLGTHGGVLAAGARIHRAVGHVERSLALFERAVATGDAPPGARIQLARLLLSRAYSDEDEARARTLLEADSETYTDLDALDLLVRLVSAAGDERRARELERALRTLQRTQGLARIRQAAALLASRRFVEAMDAARAARTTWPEQPAGHELEGLAMLCAIEAAHAGGPAIDAAPADAAARLEEAVQRSRDPAAAHARAKRMLAWFGHTLAEQGAPPPADAE